MIFLAISSIEKAKFPIYITQLLVSAIKELCPLINKNFKHQDLLGNWEASITVRYLT